MATIQILGWNESYHMTMFGVLTAGSKKASHVQPQLTEQTANILLEKTCNNLKHPLNILIYKINFFEVKFVTCFFNNKI